MDGCEHVRVLLAQSAAGESLPPEAAAHLARCPECAALAAAYRRSVDAFGAEGRPEVAPSPSDVAVVVARTRARRARRRWAMAAASMAACVAVVVLGAYLLPDRRDAPPSSTAASDPVRPPPAGGDAPDLTGDATILAGDGPAIPVMGVSAVADGRVVQTGSGEALLADARTARVSLAPRTRVKVERWQPERSVLWLEEGGLEAQVQHRAPGEVFEVRTPLAIIRVVGTRFVVTHRAEGGTEIVGLEGEVTVETPDGKLVAHVTPGRSVRLGPVPPDAPAPTGLASAIQARAAPRPVVEAREPAEERVVPDVLVAEARRLLADGRDGEALDLLRKAVDASTPGDSARVLAALAEAYRLAGRSGDAVTTFERCLSAGPGPAPESAFVGYTDLLVSQGRAADAAKVWDAYVRTWPAGRHLGRALRELAAFAEMDGRPEDATALRRRLVQDAPRSREAVEVFVDLGLRMARGGDLAGAATWFEVKREAESRDLAEAAWVGLMRVRFEEGRFDVVRRLADQYRRRFPVGGRRDEVDRLVRALPLDPAPAR